MAPWDELAPPPSNYRARVQTNWALFCEMHRGGWMIVNSGNGRRQGGPKRRKTAWTKNCLDEHIGEGKCMDEKV